ncbi:hypothetical protein [Nocardioides daphniae]|uniref:Uncharacterized protein n=1 Tax=Nocardioides daphniae TaxID=402297 RepID=A0A4V1CWJ8_9ACTN|nr:hypothetical protein [Nocardioides daphniae]QCC77517.1 hypothetical protein E2C04_10640 [Nocardioides daphniae]
MIDSGGRPDQPAGWWERASLRVRVVLVGLALALVGGVVGAVQIWGDDDGTPSATSAGYVVPATADDLERLVADHVAQFGTSRSYGVSLQAALSVVRAPVDEGSGRYQEWRPTREGGFEAGGEVRDAGEYREFDLADVDLAALDANLDAAWEGLRVPDPTYDPRGRTRQGQRPASGHHPRPQRLRGVRLPRHRPGRHGAGDAGLRPGGVLTGRRRIDVRTAP